MKKFVWILAVSILFLSPVWAKEKQYPDPYFLSTPVKEFVPKDKIKDVPIKDYKALTEGTKLEETDEDGNIIDKEKDNNAESNIESSDEVKPEDAPDEELEKSISELKKKKQHPKFNKFKEKYKETVQTKNTRRYKAYLLDKEYQPKLEEDYQYMAQEIKRYEIEPPKPILENHPKIIMPNMHYRVVSFNSPPGQRDIDISRIIYDKTAVSPAILSPDKTKMVYTKCFFYPKFVQTSAAAYFIPIQEESDAYNVAGENQINIYVMTEVTNTADAYTILVNRNNIQQDMTPIVTVGMDTVNQYKFTTLFPLDWSKDSQKIAFKEKMGSNMYGTWITNIIVYNFKTQSWKRLSAVREAIIYWWRVNQKIELKDYMWDIFPVGWDKNNYNRLIVYAFAYTKDKTRYKYLGTWSIDYNEESSALVDDNGVIDIDLNGFGLQEIPSQN